MDYFTNNNDSFYDISYNSFYSNEICDAEVRKLKKKLLKQYENKSLDDIFNGEVLSKSTDTCYYIKREESFSLDLPSEATIRNLLLEELTLVYGIGEILKSKLQEEGYNTLIDLQKHPRFSNEARRIANIIEKGTAEDILNIIPNNYPKSHPLILLLLSSFGDKKNFVMIDVESLGLSGVPIFLIGHGEFTSSKVIVHLCLARNADEEYLMLKKAPSHINKNSILISFNGLSFDLPFH